MAGRGSSSVRQTRKSTAHKKSVIYFIGIPSVKTETMTVVTAEQWVRDMTMYPGLMACFTWHKVRTVGKPIIVETAAR